MYACTNICTSVFSMPLEKRENISGSITQCDCSGVSEINCISMSTSADDSHTFLFFSRMIIIFLVSFYRDQSDLGSCMQKAAFTIQVSFNCSNF